MELLKMKRTWLIALALVWATYINTPLVQAQKQASLPGKVVVTRTDAGKVLQVRYDLENITKYYPIADSELLQLRLAYSSNDGTHKVLIDSLFVAGSSRYKLINRRIALGNAKNGNAPYPNMADIVKLSAIKKGKEEAVLQRTLPFERWMLDGVLSVEQVYIGCADCKMRQQLFEQTVEIPHFNKNHFAYHFIAPKAVAQKEYKEDFSSRVRFQQGKYELLRNFENNTQELRSINDFINKALALASKGATLRKATLTGYASPEGEFHKNQILSEQRTETLLNYVKGQFPTLQKQVQLSAKSKGEDWDGLRKAVSESRQPWKNQVVEIIDRYKTDIEREADIKALDGGAVYNTLLNEFYPPLRRTDFTFAFEVRPYKVEELPDIFDAKPALLSHYEMFELAQKYYIEKNTDPTKVFATAYEFYGKTDVIATLNYANALMRYHSDAKKALDILNGIQHDERSYFPIAMAYEMLGNHALAEEWLYKAADKGDTDAQKALQVINQ